MSCRCGTTDLLARRFFMGIALLLILNFVFFGNDVFAEDDISVTVSSGSIEFELLPGLFGTEDETITVTTTNTTGYHVDLGINGSTNGLINVEDGSLELPTFSLPSGEESIPVSSLGYGYGYSIDGGNNFYPLPEAGTFVQLFEEDNGGTNQYVLTYGAKPGYDIPSGTYINTVIIRAVANLAPCEEYNICYYGNGDDKDGEMDDQPASSNTKTTLMASNFSRPGYGFAGWNTAIDGSGTTYGPSQAITTGDLSAEGLQLYARWIQSTGDLQTFAGCNAMHVGDVIALTDTRDGNTYAVAKQADDHCWMIENLRLDLSDPDLVLSDINTNNPQADFANTINTTHPGSRNDFCEMQTPNENCVNQIAFNINNIDRELTASYNTNDNQSSWFSYGVYYNWYTATAGYGSFSFSTSGAAVSGDICPAGWRLPTGNANNGDFAKLDVILGGSGGNNQSVASSERWRAFPLNFIYSGEQRGSSGYNRDTSGGYATANTSNNQRHHNFWLQKTKASMSSNSNLKPRGQTVRCVFSGDPLSSGTIQYNNNGGVGVMNDDVDVDFSTATAASNSFTRENAYFLYWNTQPDGRGVTVAEGGRVADAATEMGIPEGGTLTLYAIWHSIFDLVYDGNDEDAGSMSTATHGNLLGANTINLIPSNYSRIGYGFAGWSFDDDAATKLANGIPVEIYGPNETIALNNDFFSHADTDNKIRLYAVWIEADQNYTLQSFGTSQCNDLTPGSVLALEDIRDNEVYSVAKLGDGNCWMIENLRLDPGQVTFSDQNTNSPTAAFISSAPSSSSQTTLCGDDDSNCIDKIGFNAGNIDRNLTPHYNDNARTYMWYSYGVLYNWYTASAGNGDFNMDSGSVTGDLCPAGWRLPTGGSGGEYEGLNTAVNNGRLNSDTSLRQYPNNFIYSGDFNQTTYGGRGSFGRWWSATAATNAEAYRFGITRNQVTPINLYSKWDAFAIRCIVK